ncbi:hypothetical protein D9M69_681960 [compost metagenome]
MLATCSCVRPALFLAAMRSSRIRRYGREFKARDTQRNYVPKENILKRDILELLVTSFGRVAYAFDEMAPGLLASRIGLNARRPCVSRGS